MSDLFTFENHQLTHVSSPAARMQEERVMHEAKLAKMEAEMKMVFQQKVQEKESKLKQSEEELYARHKEMKDALEKQRLDLEEKKKRIETGRPLTPEKNSVCSSGFFLMSVNLLLSFRHAGRVCLATARLLLFFSQKTHLLLPVLCH